MEMNVVRNENVRSILDARARGIPVTVGWGKENYDTYDPGACWGLPLRYA